MNDELRNNSSRTSEGEKASKHGIDIAQETRELAAINPRVAREIRRIIDSGQQPSVSLEPLANAATETPASRPIDAAVSPAVVAAPSQVRAPGKKSPPQRTRSTPNLEMHQAHCRICLSDHRQEIDEAFVSWENVRQLAYDFKIDRRAIYRHAHATGLYDRRDRNIRRALGRIISEADTVAPTADAVVRAIKILTHVNARGEWVNPSTRVVFSNETHANAARISANKATHHAE
jgi:hypothetical protein